MHESLPELSEPQRRALHEPWPTGPAPTAVRQTIRGCRIASEVWPQVHLYGIRLDQVHLEEIRWAEIRATHSHWTASQITASTWTNGTFSDVVFEDVQFNDAALASCTFERCRFQRCRFASSRLLECVFRECTFSESEFVAADIARTTLCRCTLKRCRFTNTRMTGTLDETVIGPGFAQALQLTNIEGTTATLHGLEIERISVLGAALEALLVRECHGRDLALCDLSAERLTIEGGQPLVGLGIIGGRLSRLTVDGATLVLANVCECHIQNLRCDRAQLHDCAFEHCTIAQGSAIAASRCHGLVIADSNVHGLTLPGTAVEAYLDVRDSRFSKLDLRSARPAPDLDLMLHNIVYEHDAAADSTAPNDRWELLRGT